MRGGEPLLSMPAISSVMHKIKNELKNIEITSSMTTNGYLLYGTTLSTLLTLEISSLCREAVLTVTLVNIVMTISVILL